MYVFVIFYGRVDVEEKKASQGKTRMNIMHITIWRKYI